MPKALVPEHYITVIQMLIKNNWIVVNPCDCYEEGEIALHCRIQSPEKLLLKKDGYENLSNEAKEIIQTVLNCPEEMLHIFQTKHKNIFSKNIARKYFRKSWNSKFIVDMTFIEIGKWVKTL